MLSVALAGKPNAGKSTFYTAATMADVDIANYPFTTIDPNRGITHVRTRCPCLDRDRRCDSDDCHDGKRYVPIELLDVAGLVPGAHDGRGLGNQFLDELSDADVVVNVVDAAGATDEEGQPVEIGSHDPMTDVDFVAEEMTLWLAAVIDRNWEAIERRARSPDFDLDTALTETLTGLGASTADLTAVLRAIDYPADPTEWDDDDRVTLATELRERTKPMLVAANKADIAAAETLDPLTDLATPAVPTTAEGELALRRAARDGLIEYDPGDPDFDVIGDPSDDQRTGLERIRTVMTDYGGTGVQRALNDAVYDLLDRITVFPVRDATHWTDSHGTMLPDAYLLPTGATPLALANAVHSDIGEGYLHAIDARTGREIGEDHELEDGAVVKIVSTAT